MKMKNEKKKMCFLTVFQFFFNLGSIFRGVINGKAGKHQPYSQVSIKQAARLTQYYIYM